MRLANFFIPAFVLLASGFLQSAEKPNLLLFYLDNVGYGDLGCYGNAEVKTPRIDRLAAEGVRCTDFHVVASTCTVSRGALLTGRYPLRNGLLHQLVREENRHGIGLPHRERILPQYLKEAGYATACFGKWNIGFAPGSRPTERGFDEFFGFRSGNINYYTHTYHGERDLFRGTEPVTVEGYSTDLFADAAIDFIRRRQDEPWFVYLPFNAVHFLSAVNMEPGEKPVWQVPGKYLEAYGWPADDPDERHRYLAVLTALDDAIGRVLDTIDDLELRQRTLVMLISDNGAFMLPGRGLEVASNAPLRDGGTTAYEGGVKVPAILRWPGQIEAGSVCGKMLSHLDIVPLCLGAGGEEMPADRILDGRDPLPALKGEAESPHPRLVFHYAGAPVGLREGNLKIVRSKEGRDWELYDLASDPSESHDLAKERPDDVTRLAAAFEAWRVAMKEDASEAVRYSAEKVDYTVKLETVMKHDPKMASPSIPSDGDFLWFHPRTAPIPGGVVMTIQKHLGASDYYSGLHFLRREGTDGKWEGPVLPAEIDWQPQADGVTISVADVTPGWHDASRKLIAIGCQVRYSPKGRQLDDVKRAHQTVYAVFDPDRSQWTPWQVLQLPDEEQFNFARNACSQWVVKEDGKILLPLYIGTSAKGPYATTVAECRFDGGQLIYERHGNVMRLDIARGLYEPSLIAFRGRYYLTLRNDERGYITSGANGLHFDEPVPWTFDDGSELGSYNTQQHWIAHRDALFLVYTRRGADNDHIVRHRAPLFMGRVDPKKLQVIRATEKIVVPERGAELGNFGCARINENEAWVTVSEGLFMKDSRSRGAEGATFVARILWKTPDHR